MTYRPQSAADLLGLAICAALMAGLYVVFVVTMILTGGR